MRAPRPIARLALAGLLALATSCQSTPAPELVPLTTELRARYELSDDELRALQYYISDQIVLERVATRGQRSIKRGRLIDRYGTLIQRVVVEFGTPGIIEPASLVAMGKRGHAIEVSFERGAPLKFTAQRADGSYSLAGMSSGGILEELFASWGMQRTRTVMFDGAEWKAVAGEGARLLIAREALGDLARRKRVLPGVELPD
jgi:hypothetical protein